VEGFLPDYGFGCRRSLPTQSFAESLLQENVEMVRAGVVGFTETGVIDSKGQTTEVDMTICATSFHPSVPNFKIIGPGGRDLATQIQSSGRSYLSIMNEGFPNMFCMAKIATALTTLVAN
jgi:cation diffusion facilitator CzcD-associated flavoprotein CzcO